MKLNKVEKKVTRKLGMSNRNAKKACKVVRQFGYDAGVSAAGELIVIGVCSVVKITGKGISKATGALVSGTKSLTNKVSKKDSLPEEDLNNVIEDEVEA